MVFFNNCYFFVVIERSEMIEYKNKNTFAQAGYN